MVTEKDFENEIKVSSKIYDVLDNAGITKPEIKHGLTFENIFNFTPHEIQNAFFNSVEHQGVYILEAPMGLGKTEAALYAAYKVLEAGFATGIYFALPTQLTSNKIYERMQQFIDKIVENKTTKNLHLLHNSAWLYSTEMGGDGAPGGSWFDNRKRGLLASFGVGTIDQALMAAMNVKHGFVRTYGLAGKVVILDEVHSYDSYTGTILDHLIKVLRQIDCTVIILSATLTTERRDSLLDLAVKSETEMYPRISCLDKINNFKENGSIESDCYNVKIAIAHHDENAVEEVLKRAELGEQVLWIENTVNDAQEMFKIIGGRAESCNIECGLLHSRFLKCDRTTNEDHWVELYGNNAGAKRYLQGRILIGTQVLEQSIDIDSDFLVSRLAPSDMLLQRIGRLWRHRKNDESRPNAAVREMWILAPEMDTVLNNCNAFGNYGFVYSPYVLYRTLLEWVSLDTIQIPQDIPLILNKTYKEKVETGIIAGHKGELQKKIDNLRRFALIGVSRSGVTLPEIKAETRYSETESVDVLLLKACNKMDDNKVKIEFVNGDVLMFDIKAGKNFKEKKRIAALIISNTVQVPERYAPVVNIKQIDWLKEYVYIGDERDNPFRVAIVRKNGELISIGNQNCMNGYSVHYTKRLGYQAAKLSKE